MGRGGGREEEEEEEEAAAAAAGGREDVVDGANFLSASSMAALEFIGLRQGAGTARARRPTDAPSFGFRSSTTGTFVTCNLVNLSTVPTYQPYMLR